MEVARFFLSWFWYKFSSSSPPLTESVPSFAFKFKIVDCLNSPAKFCIAAWRLLTDGGENVLSRENNTLLITGCLDYRFAIYEQLNTSSPAEAFAC